VLNADGKSSLRPTRQREVQLAPSGPAQRRARHQRDRSPDLRLLRSIEPDQLRNLPGSTVHDGEVILVAHLDSKDTLALLVGALANQTLGLATSSNGVADPHPGLSTGPQWQRSRAANSASCRPELSARRNLKSTGSSVIRLGF